MAPGQIRALRLGFDERIGHDLHREDGDGPDHQSQDDQGRLAGTAHRFSQRQPGQKRPANGEDHKRAVDDEEDPDHEAEQEIHPTAPLRSAPAAGASIRPSRMRTVRRARSATCGLWVTSTMVWPSLFMRTSSSTITLVTSESRLPVGSSAQTTAGLCTNARATATRCCSPPESWSGRWLARCARPSVSSISSARRRESRELRFWSRSGISTFSTAESTGSRLKAWKTKPMFWLRYAVRARSDIVDRSWPSTTTCPPSKPSSPDRQLSNVVLPEPDGPTMATISPRSIERSIPRSASTSLAPW